MPVIATNSAANTSLRYLNLNSASQSSYLAKLSSGSRITSAKDDAGGLGVGTRLQSDVASLAIAGQNSAQGQAVAQAADGALARIADILQRMRSLAIQEQNGALDAAAKTYLDAEYQQLNTQITSILMNTTFNGTPLLNGAYNQNFLVSQVPGDFIALNLTAGLPAAPAGAVTNGNGAAAVTAIDMQINATSLSRATVGALMSRFDFQGQITATSMENLDAARSVIMDADIAEMQTKFTNAETLTEAAIAALSAANEIPSELLRLLQ